MLKKYGIWSLLCIVSLFLVWCGQNPTDTSSGDDTIRIGVIAPLSGPAATYGKDALHGYEYIVDTVNEAWWVDGKQLELVVEDGKCSAKDAVSAVQKLLNVDKVAVIAWWVCSSETIAAGKIAQQQKVPMLSALSSAPDVSAVGDYVFRYWNDLNAGQAMIDYLESIDANNIAIVYENTDYAVAYSKVIKDGFAGTVLIDEKFASEEKDFGILAKKLTDSVDDIDALVYIPQSEANVISFVKALQAEGTWEALRSKFLGTESVLTQGTIDGLWDVVNGIRWVNFPELTSFGADVANLTQDILGDYEAESSSTFVLFSADALQTIVDGLQEVWEDAQALREYFASFTEENPRDGFIGSFYFDGQDGQGIDFAIVEIMDGEIKEIE